MKGGEKIKSNLIKKIILLIILLTLFLITISSVNAAEHNITNTTEGGLNKTVTDTINGDIINLEEGVYNGNNNTKISIVSSKNITIQSKSPKQKAIIDGKNINWFINNEGSLTLKNLIITNTINSNKLHGGAIWNNGTLIIINCTFTNSEAPGYGGVIYNLNDGMINIFNSKFENNYAKNGGGALNHMGKELNIDNCIFINNSSQYLGGAIESRNKLTIKNSTFINNTIGNENGTLGASYGSAIRNNGIEMLIDSCNFINNNVLDGFGGAIQNSGQNATIINSNFINNTATTNGGAIFNQANGLKIIGCNFTNNKAIKKYGGAILNYRNCTIINSNFTNNTANYGGAIFNYNGNLNVANSNFAKNNANNDGGSIYNYNANLNVINSNFTNNKALMGAAICAEIGNMNVSGCNIINNSNGIYIDSSAKSITINYNRIFNNTGYDLNNGAITIDANYNWWGNNTPDLINKIIGVMPENYFIMNVTNLISLDSSGTLIFKYTFKLNNSDSFNASLLPHFMTNALADVVAGGFSNDYFDARFDQEFTAVIMTTSTEQIIKFIFATDNEIQTLERLIIPEQNNNTINNNTNNNNNGTDDYNNTNNNNTDKNNENTNIKSGNNNETNNNPATSATMKSTGIPINLILIVLLTSLGLIIRKKQK